MQVTSLLGGDKPEKEVVRINLPPKPRGGPLIKLPQLPLGSPASKNVEPKVEEKVPGFYKKGDGEMKPELFIEGFNLSDRLVWPRVDYNAKLEEIKLKINRSPCVLEFEGEKYNKEVSKCLRIWPQDNDTEGFFIAKIRKG